MKLCGKLFRNAPAVGVDIGSHSVKVVCLRKISGNRAAFSASAGEVSPRSGSVRNGETGDLDDSVLDGLSSLCEDLGVKGGRAAVSISGSSVFTSSLKVSPSAGKSRRRIRDEVLLHLQRFFPEGMDGFYSDFCPNPQDPDEVLVAVAKKDAVDGCVSVLSASGLVPEVADYEGFAVVNAYKWACAANARDGGEGVTVLLNIGRSATNLAALENSKPVFIRDLSRGSGDLPCGAPDGGPGRSAREFARALAAEVGSNLEAFLGGGKKKAGKVVLSGGGSLVCGLRDTVAEELRAEVEYADPLGGLPAAEGDGSRPEGLSRKAAVAFGLALRMAERPPLRL